MDILRTENVSKIYGIGDTRVTALDKLNLKISKGQFVSIIGPSGSGKSTLLHMLGGVDRPTEGKIYIEETDISSMNETESALFRRRKIGLIYQSYNLISTLNVKKNILLPMLLDSIKPNQEEFDHLVEMLGLTERLNHLPSQLSGGQQQRVAIGRSLIYKPSIILADEPTGNLDRKNTKATLDLLKLSNKEFNQTIVMITHDEEIASSADRVITIVDGRIVSDEVNKK
ncbi:ABC transporter ATP-binding protein [Clostridium saccharobutylicum]|uniref:ABC transporter ATP-binding protein n=1 Tax=Clostridium saccharobutylicum DSM 13864 TaxID=1345695 RepID=U5MPM8_CLOSA|nr:ABC transporter ATP-binding protein [Clostridium saccharobutylicum]AGX41646.1 ABC transporter ATP-binding protein [Clostridium saccharobutylicum DSM 13864]AQR88928.1 lipoprotein-releasing system ATP-binding protein LolD [Clostridium saccharobutylicum]AQR98829.1 lipoprotein-releasing system ATP-binding protein LolD [Clostridium saccharobutylicum]AQS12817.1 lipoprotein-releasing system ATP-binding protein LolD [Clostridium saccharobutylicum]MBA2904070.1 putative ABC transport system ATP-bindi